MRLKCSSRWRGCWSGRIYTCCLARKHGGDHMDMPGVRGVRWSDKEAMRD